MSGRHDVKYLKEVQYKDAANVDARVYLHDHFSTNKQGLHEWIFDQLPLSKACRVLELGAGPGHLWRKNIERIPSDWEITVTDLSSGMVQESRACLSRIDRMAFAVIDAQSIPYDDESFDVVIANAMFYHVPNRPQAYAEIRRVLRSKGSLFASTGSGKGMRELYGWMETVAPDTFKKRSAAFSDFNLESGSAEMRELFSSVSYRLYEDSLRVTEIEPMMAYVASTRRLEERQMSRIREIFEQELAEKGVISITKDGGVIVASR